MTGPGRPSTGVRVQVRIPADLLERIDELARSYDPAVTRAAVIRGLLAERLAHD
jgi:metal-responsive CopG/Arc/MetJ family transcriptional regulator